MNEMTPMSSAVGAPVPNIVATIFNRYGGLEPMVTRRNLQSFKIREMHELRGYSKRNHAIALDRLKRIPPLDDLRRDIEGLTTAAFGRAPEPEARLIIATMLEALPTAGAQCSATFIDAIIDTVDHYDDDREYGPRFNGFSCEVLASTTRKVWKQHKFPPAIAELMEILCKTRLEYWYAIGLTEHLIALRDDAEDMVAIMSNDPPPADAEGIPF